MTQYAQSKNANIWPAGVKALQLNVERAAYV